MVNWLFAAATTRSAISLMFSGRGGGVFSAEEGSLRMRERFPHKRQRETQ